MMARCLANERQGLPVFYGAMIAEGIIALIWATLAISFFPTAGLLNDVLGEGGPCLVVNKLSTTLLGSVGGVLAIIGVVVLPVTSGDTAFRSARLIVADVFKISQKESLKRLGIAVPLFVVGVLSTFSDFGLIWRYFGWANQTLAVFVLWTAAVYLAFTVLACRPVAYWCLDFSLVGGSLLASGILFFVPLALLAMAPPARRRRGGSYAGTGR